MGDDQLVEDVAARLKATGAFDRVAPFAHPEDTPKAAERAVAWVWWSDAHEENTDVLGTPDKVARDRTVTLGVAIEVREPKDANRTRRLARLESVARNAVEGRAIAGGCRPGATRFAPFAVDRTIRPPAARAESSLTCVYGVIGNAHHDDAAREEV